jgi:hypothetical protein
MKSINTKIQTLALLMSLILLLFGPGCASNSGGSGSPGGSASGGSRTLKQVDLDVSPKMTRFQNASGAGVTEGEKDQVKAAYSRYQSAYHQALQAAGNNPNTPAPANVTAAADELIGVLGSIQ